MAEVGLPQELNAKLDYTCPAEVSSIDVRLFPTNISSVQTGSISFGTSVGRQDLPLPTSTFSFSLPAGSKGQFLDHRFTRLNFRVNYQVDGATSGATKPISTASLSSSAHSWIQRVWSESQSGVVITDQPNYDIVADVYNQFAYDVASRDCNALSLGFESTNPATNAVNSNTGHLLPVFTRNNVDIPTGSNLFSYSIPVLDGLVGAWAKRFFAIGQVNRHTLNFQLPALAPIALNVSQAATTGGTIKLTIDQVSLSVRIINIPMEAMKMAGKDRGVQYYNGQVSRVASQSLGKATGSNSWLIGIRGSSVKNLIARFTEDVYTTAGCCNRQFDSKMPFYTSIGYNINGVNLPASPDDLVRAPAQAFSRTQMAMAQFNEYDFKSGIVPSQFCKYAPAGSTPSDLDYNVATIGGDTSSTSSLCSFHYGINLERISKAGILSGSNLNSSNCYLNTNGSIAPTNNITAYFVALLDSLVVHDTETGELSVRL